MSEPKLISPLLDGFRMGAPISDHDGVQCCPAMKENSDSKYIVKIISIPASQVQLDALLLTGAYTDPASAMDYFQELADGVAEEAKILKKLSKLEGFLPYDNWQIEPMDENQLGYQVYLVSSYKRSLDKFLSRNTITHLGAVNLGLDMCSALAVSRRAGRIYADLKPTNIFISEDKQYRIGDLGFLDMNSLKYTSLPSKYVSEYTAPELKDALTTVNTTVDTYAVGMILYQIYNNGKLPTLVEEESLPAPVHADDELAEIILKACALDPKERYGDPMEMGRALVAYMQRNRVNDTPITPATAEAAEEAAPLEDTDETVPTESDAENVMPESITEETAERDNDLVANEVPAPAEEPESDEIPVEELPAEAEETPKAETEDVPDTAAEVTQESETSEPEKMPERITEDKPKKDVRKPKKAKKKKKKNKNGSLVAILIILLLALLGCGGFLFFHEYYLQAINAIQVEGVQDEMTVILDTETDNSLLTITVTDAYGNSKQSGVQNNQAHFDGLTADTLYKIKVEISGFHKLDGVSTQSYTSPAETSIASFNAKTGPEDGSVVLSFAVNGPDSPEWSITASAEGEEPITEVFSSHTVTLTGLTVGKIYNFTLEPVAELFLVGENAIEFCASPIVMAENLTVSDYNNGTLTVTWNAPEGASVDSWSVHCYSNDGVDKTLTTVDTTATFNDIDTAKEYTIEVLAAGMSESTRTSVSPNPAKLSNIQVNADEDPSKLIVTWDYEGEISDAGWHVMYSVDGCMPQGIVEASEARAEIQPRIPGATYDITIVPASGSSAFDNTVSFDCPNAEIFSYPEAGITTNSISNKLKVNLLVTPEKEKWSYTDISSDDYTSTFTPGEKASLMLYLNQKFYTAHADINIMFVIRDQDKNVRNDLVSQTVMDWSDMWDGSNYRYCELDIPKFPVEAGKYALYVYFNNQAITIINFTVTE